MLSAYSNEGDTIDWTADDDYSAGDIIQLPDGRPGQITVDIEGGKVVGVRVRGILVNVAKTATFVALEGNRAYWDVSANKVHYKKVNDRDFYLGRFAADGEPAGDDETCSVVIGVDPKPDIDLLTDPALSVPTGTQAVGGFGFPKVLGGAAVLQLTATNEAQCIDMLSVDRFSPDAKFIAEFIIRPDANGSTSDVDFNLGIANGTSTTDADAVTQHVFAHVDGGSANILSQSKDGVTTVAADDTGADISAGSAVANRSEIWIDGRDKTNVKIFVDGVRVNADVVHTLAAATGPLGLLVHLEKSTGTATARFTVDRAVVRYQR